MDSPEFEVEERATTAHKTDQEDDVELQETDEDDIELEPGEPLQQEVQEHEDEVHTSSTEKDNDNNQVRRRELQRVLLKKKEKKKEVDALIARMPPSIDASPWFYAGRFVIFISLFYPSLSLILSFLDV